MNLVHIANRWADSTIFLIKTPKYKYFGGNRGAECQCDSQPTVLHQHNYLYLPAIGINTLKNIKVYDYEGLFIEKNKCIIIEKEKIVDFCNKNNLFLATTDKIDSK